MQKTNIWSNPSYQRSLVQPAVVKNEINEYLNLSIQGIKNRDIKIFPGMEYKFSFYDDTYGIKRTITGLVDRVYIDQIKIICLDKKKDMVNCKSCPNKICGMADDHILRPMPTCGCVLNPPDVSKYDTPRIYFIPVANIMDVSYILNEAKPDNNKRRGTRIMILGISATILKAIIVRLEFFDDNEEEAIKLVDLEAGKIYDLVYECDGSIYESRAKVISIEESRDEIDNKNSPVRENIGFDNKVIFDKNCHCKHDFMNEPPVRKIKITIDTSELFDGNLEVISLDSIRDCTLVEDAIDDNTDEDTSLDINSGCDCYSN